MSILKMTNTTKEIILLTQKKIDSKCRFLLLIEACQNLSLYDTSKDQHSIY